MKVDIKEGMIFAIYDNIAERLVSVFYARNEADAQRYVKANFLKAEPVVREGLVLTVLLDIEFYRYQNPGMFEAKTIDEVLGPSVKEAEEAKKRAYELIRQEKFKLKESEHSYFPGPRLGNEDFTTGQLLGSEDNDE